MKRNKPSVKVEDDVFDDPQDDPSDDDDTKEVQVDFDLYNQSEIDFLSVKNYCRALLANVSGDLDLAPQVAQAVLDADIGSVVKSEGYTDALAVITVLPLWGEKVQAWAGTFLARAGIAPADAQGLGLLVNLRIINMPVLKLAPAMHKCLFSEVDQRPKTAEKYTKYLLFAPYYFESEIDEEDEDEEDEDDEDDDEEEEKKDKKAEGKDNKTARKQKKLAKKKAKTEASVKAQAKEAQQAASMEKIFVRAEEELYVDAAESVKDVKPSLLSSSVDAHSLLVPKHTLAVVVPASRIPGILKRMHTEFMG